MDNLSAVPESLRQPDKASSLNTFVFNKCLNSVDPDRREATAKHLAGSLLQNRQLQEVVSAAQTTGILHEYEYAHKNLTKIYVKAKLTGAEQCRLSNTFGMFNLDFSRADDSGPHAFARAHRRLSMEMLLKHAQIDDKSVPAPGYDALFKDVGGNPVAHLTNDRYYSHCCSPVLDINDAARKSRYYNHLRTVSTSGMSVDRAHHYNQHIMQDGRVVCSTVAEHCHVKAPVLLFIHSVYDIRLQDIAQMMYNADATVGLGCFIFDVSVIYNTEGELPAIGCCFKRFRRNGRVMIRFWFPKDTQLGYEHDFIHYIELVYSFTVRHASAAYITNIIGIHDNVAFFEVLRNTSGDVPACRAFRVLTDSTLDDTTVINYWHFETLNSRFIARDQFDRMVPCRLLVPTSLFDNLTTYAFNLPESKFTVKNILCAATSLNNRFVTNGAVVKTGPKISPFELQKLAHAVYLLVYISTYECSQALINLLKQETNVRELSDSGVVKRLWSNIRLSLRERFSSRPSVAATNFRLPDDVEDAMDESLCDNSTFIKRFVNWFAKRATVRRLLNVDVQQSFVKYFSVESEINEIVQNVHRSGRSVVNDSLLDLDPYRAMVNSLSDEKGNSLRRLDISACKPCRCRTRTKLIANSSRGDCVLQSLIDSGSVQEDSVHDLKFRLEKSSHLANFSHCPSIAAYLSDSNVSDLQPVTLPPALELLMLCALEFRIGVCVHLASSKSAYTFSRGNVVHFLVKDSHCSYLEAWHEMPPTESFELTESTSATYDCSNSRVSEHVKTGELAKTFTAMESTDRALQLARAIKLSDPESVANSFGYRSLHGVFVAEACIRGFDDRNSHSRSSLVVGATSVQLEAFMSTVNGVVHFVPANRNSDVREFTSEHRLIQYSDQYCSTDLTSHETRLHTYLAAMSRNPTGFERVMVCNIFFRHDFIECDNDKYFTVVPVNFHFALSVLKIGGTACLIITEIASARAVNFLSIIKKLFTRVTVSRLRLVQQAFWVFSVACEGYNGNVHVRNLLVNDENCPGLDSCRLSLARLSDTCSTNVNITIDNVIDELNHGKKLRFFNPATTAAESALGDMLSNKFTGMKSLSSPINRPVTRTRGRTLDTYVKTTLKVQQLKRKFRFEHFANISTFDKMFVPSVSIFPELDGLVTLEEKVRDLEVVLPILFDCDASIDTVRTSAILTKRFSWLLGKKLCRRLFGITHKLACAKDTTDLGIGMIYPTGVISVTPSPDLRTHKRSDEYVVSDSDSSDSDDDPESGDSPHSTATAPVDTFSTVANDAPPVTDDKEFKDAGAFEMIGMNPADFDHDLYSALKYMAAQVVEESFDKDSNDAAPTPELSCASDITSEITADDIDSYDIPDKITVKVSAPSRETVNARSLMSSLAKSCKTLGKPCYNGADITPTSALKLPVDSLIAEPKAADGEAGMIFNAVEEYKNMLMLTHSAHTSNLSRVYNRYVSGISLVSSKIEPSTFDAVPKDSVIIPHAKDFGIIDRKFRWVIKPSSGSDKIDDYRWYYDGDKIKPFAHLRTSKTPVIFSDGVGHVVVNDYCKLALDGTTYEAVQTIDVSAVSLKSINFVQAVPGAGKTTYIINSHVPYYVADEKQVSNVILCTTEGKTDFHDRMRRKAVESGVETTERQRYLLQRHYVTLASFLINNSKVRRSDSLFIDEAFMHHPGALFLVIAISGAKYVQILGDCKQIPYVNRLESFTMEYGDLNKFISPTTIMNKSYRCPVDVAKFLSPVYALAKLTPANDSRGMVSVRPVATRSMHVEKFAGVASLMSVKKDTQILTFTQSCKSTIIAAGYENVSTVHEFEGKQASDIVLVRDTDSLEDRLPNDMNYITVAVSRHTNKFTYYTKRTDDKLSKMLRTFYSNSVDYSSFLDTSAGSIDFSTHYMGEIKKMMAPDSYKTFNRRDPGGRSFSNILHIVKSGESSVTVTVNSKARNITLALKHEINAKSLRAAAPQLRSVVTGMGLRELDLADSCFESLQPIVVSSILYQYVGKECRYYRSIGTKFDETPYEVFDALNKNAVCDIPNSIDMPVPEIYNFVDQGSKSATGQVDCCEIQAFVNDAFRTSAYTDQSHDSWMVHHYDLELALGPVRIISHRGLYENKKFDNMSPKLHTPIPHVRQEFTAELLVALQKRNCNVPECQGIVDVDYVSSRMLDCVVSRCFDWETTANLVSEQINVSAAEVCDWLKNQPLSVIDQIVGDFSLHDSPLNEYLLSIKAVAKPVLKRDADEAYAPLQTILYHKKFINAIFCPIFREIKARLHRCLKKNLKVFSDVSMKDFEELMDRDISDGSFALFSGDDSLIYNGESYLEVDISKYDKSQGDLALEYELKYMRFFGVPEYYIELWRNAHVSTVARSMSTGVKISVNYQRKSGDASTFLGNTMFLIGILASVMPFDNLDGIDYSQYMNSHVYNYVFNLEVKFFRYKIPYFCSKFLIRKDHGWRMVPDPVKLVCKLGRHDLVNEEHVECYRVSLSDHLEGFRYDEVCYDVATAVIERYQVEADYSFFFARLPSVIEKSCFSELYEALPGANIDRTRNDFNMRD